MDLKQAIKDDAIQLGFSAIGIAKAEYDPISHNRYLRWLDKGNQADMKYLERGVRQRFDPKVTLPTAKSVIVCALNYYQKLENESDKPYFSIYGRGENYHVVMMDKLKALREKIEEHAGHWAFKIYADASPISEKTFAVKAGLGFIGRNGLLILSSSEGLTAAKGSFYFLGSIITNLELEPDKSIDRNCGKCQLCIDACPTGAIDGDGTIDASRCISYNTIQNKGEIPQEIISKMSNIVFGCDICQAVCPLNRDVEETQEPRFSPDPLLVSPDLDFLRNITEEEFRKRFEKSSIGEKGYQLFKRNIAIAAENIGKRSIR
jgi:epoxyqueuosine reductase